MTLDVMLVLAAGLVVIVIRRERRKAHQVQDLQRRKARALADRVEVVLPALTPAERAQWRPVVSSLRGQ